VTRWQRIAHSLDEAAWGTPGGAKWAVRWALFMIVFGTAAVAGQLAHL